MKNTLKRSNIGLKSERIETCLTEEQKALIQRAAELQGLSLSDFVLSVVQSHARKIVHEHEVLLLSGRDSKLFVQSLFRSGKPVKEMKEALKMYKALVVSK